MLVAALLLLAGLALPGAAAQAAQGRAKQLPKCATVTETGSCRFRPILSGETLVEGLFRRGDESVLRRPVGPPRVVNSQPSDSVVARAVLVLRNPTVTVQRDGEEAMEVSPKRFAKQWTSLEENYAPFWTRGVNLEFRIVENSDKSEIRATLREETYKKSKKTGTEKLRCKLDGLDAELVDDLVGLPGPVPCTLEFRTPCDDEGEIQEMIDLFD